MSTESQASPSPYIMGYYDLRNRADDAQIDYDLSTKEYLLLSRFVSSMSRPKGMVTLTESRYRKRKDWVTSLGVTNEAYVTRLFNKLEDKKIFSPPRFDGSKTFRKFHPEFINWVIKAVHPSEPSSQYNEEMPVDCVDNILTTVHPSEPQQFTPVNPSSSPQYTPAVHPSEPCSIIEELSSTELSSKTQSAKEFSSEQIVDNSLGESLYLYEPLTSVFLQNNHVNGMSKDDLNAWFAKRYENLDPFDKISQYCLGSSFKELTLQGLIKDYASFGILWEASQVALGLPVLREKKPILTRGLETETSA